MATALLEAHSASLPVIALSNGTPISSDGKGAFQELDSVSFMRPVTKWATRIVSPETTPWVMQRAFSIAKNGRPGPVFIDVPSDIALESCSMPTYKHALDRHTFRPGSDAIAHRRSPGQKSQTTDYHLWLWCCQCAGRNEYHPPCRVDRGCALHHAGRPRHLRRGPPLVSGSDRPVFHRRREKSISTSRTL